MTFRTRLLVASMATLVVGLGALLVLGNVLLAQRVRAEAASVLRANAEAQISALDVTATSVAVRETANDAALDERGWVLDGDRVIERPPGADPAIERIAVRLGRARRAAEVTGPDDERIRAQPIVGLGTGKVIGAVVVAYSMESLESLQHSVLLGSVIVAALVLLTGWLTLRSAIDGALRPVAQMVEKAETWSAQDLEQRFALGPARDELTGLAATLDGLLARIAASRRHEQRFAAEVAHELRTPLAALRARAEVALRVEDPSTDADFRAALEAIVSQSDRLSQAIDTLLAVARQELDPTEGRVDLAALAAEIEDAEVVASGPVPAAEGDADVVRRALAPLVDNARRHTATSIRLELSAGGGRVRIAVRDDGPGVDPALGDTVFDPGVRGPGADGGAGLGLALARRLARSCGGDVLLCDGPGGCFALELPALGRPTS